MRRSLCRKEVLVMSWLRDMIRRLYVDHAAFFCSLFLLKIPSLMTFLKSPRAAVPLYDIIFTLIENICRHLSVVTV